MACLKALQKLTDSNYRLAAIETVDSSRIIEMFKRFNMETGCAVYDWNDDHGLSRLGFEHIFIPKTKSAKEIATYILNARHFGIYLLNGFDDYMDEGEIEELLAKITLKNDGIRRLVVIIDSQVGFSERLRTMSVKIQHTVPAQKPQTKVTTAAVING